MTVRRHISATICFIILVSSAIVYAHPDSGLLPDAIAETEYKIVIDLNPDDIETRNRLGIVLYRKNKLKEALEQFEAVLKVRPGDFNAHDGTGLVKMKQKQYEDAVRWFKKAIALNEKDAMVHYHLGLAYKSLGDYDRAVREFRKTLNIKHDREILKELNKLEQLSVEKR